MSRTFSRSSSGYFSVDSDSVPGSPLMPNISEAQDGQNDGKSPLAKKRHNFVVCKHNTDATNIASHHNGFFSQLISPLGI